MVHTKRRDLPHISLTLVQGPEYNKELMWINKEKANYSKERETKRMSRNFTIESVNGQ